MYRKTISLLALLILAAGIGAYAQDGSGKWLWPIKNMKAGSGIVSKPQGYVDKEFNFDALFISAPEGSEIVSPTDGTISSVSIAYFSSLTYSTSFSNDEKIKSWDKRIEGIVPEFKQGNPEFLSGSLGIDIGNGGTLNITGLRGNFSFKTGQKISKGDVLGIIGKCYHSIPDFCIDISVSRFGKPIDPMSPFGIKSSFVPPSKPVPVTELTVKQAKEDFGILTEALKEEYAGLYDCVTPAQFDSLTTAELAEIDRICDGNPKRVISYNDFRQRIVMKTFSIIHDSHFYIYPTRWLTQPRKYPGIWTGWVNDTLRCTRISSPKDSNLYMKQIVRINGMSADSCKTGMRNLLFAYDSKVQDYSNRVLFTNGCLSLVYLLNGNFGMDVEFADGTKMIFPEIPTYSYVQNWTSSARVNYNNGLDYKGKTINDSTAYLGISTFELSQVELEGVRSFIDSISKADVQHLIIDVRDNGGGSEYVLRKIFSYIASDTLHLDGYNKVNRKGGFETFKYSENYTADMDDIFPEYQAVEGKDGFYDYSNETVYSPDSLVHYRGKIYVLTNDNSISAATLLPALVIRSHRGVTVGRETRSAYHFLNATKFSQLHLPNSQIEISIPLVESVFDTVVNERVPFGRGAIPDYEVPITMDELEYKNGDAILNKALSLIAEGKYFTGPDPFAKANANHGRHIGTEVLISIIAAAVALAASLALILTRNKRRTR